MTEDKEQVAKNIRKLTRVVADEIDQAKLPPLYIRYTVANPEGNSFHVIYSLVRASVKYSGRFIYRFVAVMGLTEKQEAAAQAYIKRYIRWDMFKPNKWPDIWADDEPPGAYEVAWMEQVQVYAEQI